MRSQLCSIFLDSCNPKDTSVRSKNFRKCSLRQYGTRSKCARLEKLRVIRSIEIRIKHSFDSGDLKKRKTKKFYFYLKCANQDNRSDIKYRLDNFVYPYFDLSYFKSHPRKCLSGEDFKTKLGRDHEFCGPDNARLL